jgi:conjugative relaxase-like TrwC/TraI family protein
MRVRGVVLLTVVKVSLAQGDAYARYLEGRTARSAAGDYYLREGERVEAPGRWVLGALGASALGVDEIDGPVDAGVFRSLMAVVNPATGGPLRRVGGNGSAVGAIDCTFSAPKSVSAVWALGDPELRHGIEAAHERAADAAIEYALEFVAMIRRRVDSATVVRERPAEVLATSWRHTTARAVEGRPPDPQLHSHVLIHAAVRADGELVAVESRALFVHQRELGAAYRNVLAVELTRLGFAVEPGTGRGGRFFELAGVPTGLREAWSSRHREVREAIRARLERKHAELAARGDGQTPGVAVLDRPTVLSPAEERVAALESRAGKNTLRTDGDLDRAWWQTARPHGFDARSVERLRHRTLTVTAETTIDGTVTEALTEFDATFAAREARATALEHTAGLGVAAALAALDRLDRAGELLGLADGRCTTRAHREREHQTIELARRLAAGRVPPVDPQITQRELRVLDDRLRGAGGELSGEQTRAVRAGCSDRQLLVIEGQAGTGKSTALAAIARAHEHTGRRIVVTSTGALAAQRLAGELRASGVHANGYSTAALQANVEHGRLQLDPETTVIHDEAALASTREQRWILAAIHAARGRLILVGDPCQSRPVGAGGLWAHIAHAASGQAAHLELKEIRRTQDPHDRRDQALWRAGHHARALAGYDRRGRITITPSDLEAEDAALDAADTDRRAGHHVLVVCETSNDHLDQLNARAQAIRHQHGELGAHRLPITGRPYALHTGDIIQIRAPIAHPRLGRIANGTLGEVQRVHPDARHATITLNDGRTAHWTPGDLERADMRLAYVQHPFPAQGATADTTHLIAGPHATQQGTYVALTRAREQTRIYTSHHQPDLDASVERSTMIDALNDRLARTEPETPSLNTPLGHERRVTQLSYDEGCEWRGT